MNIYRILAAILVMLLIVGALSVSGESLHDKRPKPNTPGPLKTKQPTPIPTARVTPTVKATPVLTLTPTTPALTPTPSSGDPDPSAGACPDHSTTVFHTLWDDQRGCHFDHEHGDNPFTAEVEAAFPDYNLLELLGNVEVGHTNPSSPTENTHKHGGFKWQALPQAPQGCVTGFENAQYGVNAAVVQYHAFGNYSIEFETRIHSTVALISQCVPNSTDFGYIYTVQLQEYGQRVTPYQGQIMPYPDTPSPAYGSGFGPYLTIDCFNNPDNLGCRSTLQFILDRNLNTNSIWTSKPTGTGERPQTSNLFRLLFRVRDTYQVVDWSDQTYPFTFSWLCSNDGGATYSALAGCRYNNSTTRVHEVAGEIPAAWDNLAGFDTNPATGRISANGFTDRFGTLNLNCTAVSSECFPLKLVNAYVGRYGGELSATKVSNPDPITNPERDIYFCNGVICGETAVGAVSSGWIGPNN